MKIALDTNRYSDFCRAVVGVTEVLEHAERVYVPFVVLAELRSGFVGGTRQRENERSLQRFLSRPGVDALYADEQTTWHYAALHEQLRKQGTPVPTNDLWIAALVVQHNLHLFARDRHFGHLPQIPRV